MGQLHNKIASEFRDHYAKTFSENRTTAKGVNWVDEESAQFRYKKVLELLNDDLQSVNTPSILDVGCGYGGLLEYIKKHPFSMNYTGVELVEEMVSHAKKSHPESTFIHKDFMELPETLSYDYIICNGVLMLKKNILQSEMNRFMQQILSKMFRMCRCGIAFNIHTSYVNWFDSTLFYKSPVEMLAFCLENLSRKVKLDHAYPFYDYTVFVYKSH